jgi:hypothetical protein
MSKSLVKLVDYALLPAALLVASKFIGLFITTAIFDLSWGIENVPDSIFSVRPIFFAEDILIASTYSDLIMFIIMMIGFSFILIQAVIFHNSHISPQMLSKLAGYNLLGLVKNTFEVYHKAAIWTIFFWISNIVIFANVALRKTEAWVLIFSLLISVVLTVFLLRDVAQEIEISKKETLSKL